MARHGFGAVTVKQARIDSVTGPTSDREIFKPKVVEMYHQSLKVTNYGFSCDSPCQDQGKTRIFSGQTPNKTLT